MQPFTLNENWTENIAKKLFNISKVQANLYPVRNTNSLINRLQKAGNEMPSLYDRHKNR